MKIPQSKTNQYRQGEEILIARSAIPSHAGMIHSIGKDSAKGQLKGKEFLFRGITNTKNGKRLYTHPVS